MRANGGYCDCEMLMNVYVRQEWLRERWEWADEDDDDPAEIGAEVEPEPDAEPPECFGVRKGSTQPCAHWLPPYV